MRSSITTILGGLVRSAPPLARRFRRRGAKNVRPNSYPADNKVPAAFPLASATEMPADARKPIKPMRNTPSAPPPVPVHSPGEAGARGCGPREAPFLRQIRDEERGP